MYYNESYAALVPCGYPGVAGLLSAVAAFRIGQLRASGVELRPQVEEAVNPQAAALSEQTA